MKNINNTSSSDKVFYHYEFGLSFIILLLIPIISGGLMIYFSKDYNSLSTFINSPQNLLNDFSEWVYRDCKDLMDNKISFFSADMFFGTSFCLLMGFLFAGFYFSKKEERFSSNYSSGDSAKLENENKSEVRIFSFTFQNFKNLITGKEKKTVGRILFLIILFIAIFADIFENAFFLADWDGLANRDTGKYTALIWIQNIKVVAYAISLVFVIYHAAFSFVYDYFEKELSHSFGRFMLGIFRELVGYFYPAIFSIIILGFIFSTYNTFDNLIVEVLDSYNYPLFVLFFLFSILTAWFIPYYLKYSDSFYQTIKDDEDLDKRIRGNTAIKNMLFSRRNLIHPVTNALNKIECKNDEDLQLKEAIQAASKNPTVNPMFHLLRRALGFGFILIGLSLEGGTLDNALGTNFWKPSLVGGCVVMMIVYTVFYLRCIGKKIPELAKDGFRKTGTISTGHVKFHRFVLRSNLVLTILLLGLLVFSNVGWFWLLILLTVNTFLLAFSFIGFALYRRILERYEFVGVDKDFYNESYRGWNLRSTSFFMPTYLMVTFVGLLLLIGFGCIDINLFSRMNPLNVYLIYINGLITLIALVDRFFTLMRLRKEYDVPGSLTDDERANASWSQKVIYWCTENKLATRLSKRLDKIKHKRTSLFVLASIGVLAFFLLRSGENHYHDVEYNTYQTEAFSNDSLISLFEYTDQFLERSDSTQPIYIVAADGGGLRAAYWTMLVLGELDKKTNSNFFNNVFLTTGISGGGIGLGMYTYSKSRGFSNAENELLSNRIGGTNFLSGDLVGLVGKGALVYLSPTFFNFSRLEDRAEAMARHYFEIYNERDPVKHDYNEFKKEPFQKLWVDNNYELPLLVVNTARSEDGSRGIVHPLRYQDSNSSFVDLSKCRDKYISYPDAVFLTNRFPIISPAARIEGKGHFVDGGYLENTGLSTVLHYLQIMKKDEDKHSAYRKFLNRKIVVINIKNDKGSFVKSKFRYPQDTINRSFSSGEIGSILGAVASPGTTALPKYYEEFFENPDLLPKLLGKRKEQIEFHKIILPFRINNEDVHNAYYGQVTDCTIGDQVEINNNAIIDHHGMLQGKESEWYGKTPVLMPPLGRLIPVTTMKYMQDMLQYPTVEETLDSVIN